MSNLIFISQRHQTKLAADDYTRAIIGALAGGTLGGVGAAYLAPDRADGETEEEYKARRNSSAFIGALGGAAGGAALNQYAVPQIQSFFADPPPKKDSKPATPSLLSRGVDYAANGTLGAADGTLGLVNKLPMPLNLVASGAAGYGVGAGIERAVRGNKPFLSKLEQLEALARADAGGKVKKPPVHPGPAASGDAVAKYNTDQAAWLSEKSRVTKGLESLQAIKDYNLGKARYNSVTPQKFTNAKKTIQYGFDARGIRSKLEPTRIKGISGLIGVGATALYDWERNKNLTMSLLDKFVNGSPNTGK